MSDVRAYSSIIHAQMVKEQMHQSKSHLTQVAYFMHKVYSREDNTKCERRLSVHETLMPLLLSSFDGSHNG